MALTGINVPGATPLSDEDLQGLRVPSVTTHGELNEVEAANIIRGQLYTPPNGETGVYHRPRRGRQQRLRTPTRLCNLQDLNSASSRTSN